MPLSKFDYCPHRYEEIEESETDSDMMVTDKNPFGGGKFTPFVSSQPLHVRLFSCATLVSSFLLAL